MISAKEARKCSEEGLRVRLAEVMEPNRVQKMKTIEDLIRKAASSGKTRLKFTVFSDFLREMVVKDLEKFGYMIYSVVGTEVEVGW